MQDFDNEIQIFDAELQNIYNICANGTQEECDRVYQKLDSIYEWLNSIYDVYKIRHDWHNEENMKSDDYKNACERSRMFSRKTATENKMKDSEYYLVDGYADLLNKIIDIRHNKGTHSKTLAADSGISEKTLLRFEKGTAIPSISRFLNIIHALDCEMLIVEK